MSWLPRLRRQFRAAPPRRHQPSLQPLEDRCCPSGVARAPVTIGALGDSYTDEYRFYPPDRSQARNWLEILYGMEGPVRLGAFTTQSRGRPRDQGFALDWALQGAISGGMVREQLPGLTAQVARGQVDYAAIFIGSNDFSNFLQGVANGTVKPTQALAVLGQVESLAETHVLMAVNTLLAANPNVKVVVANLFDLWLLPQVQAFRTPAPLVAAVRQAIGEFNGAIAATAATDSRVALLDLAGTMAQLEQEAGAGGWASFGGTALDMVHTGDGVHHFILADGIHFGTVAQGMIADAFISAVDAKFGAVLTPLSSQQIVRFANRVGRDTP
jgi:hypothetical protein